MTLRTRDSLRTSCPILALCGALLGPSVAHADPVQTLPCRPTIACTADLVPAGVFEVEAGAFTRTAPESATPLSAPFLAKLSLTDWLQVQLGSAGLTLTDDRLVVDVGYALAKVRLAPQGSWSPSLALSVGGAFGVAQGSQWYQPVEGLQTALYAARDIGSFHLDLNVGYNALTAGGAGLTHSFWAAASTSVAWTRVFGTFHELYYFSPQTADAPRDGGFLFGATISPSTRVMIDVGGDVALFQSSRTFNAFVGVTVATERLWGAAPSPAFARATRSTRSF